MKERRKRKLHNERKYEENKDIRKKQRGRSNENQERNKYFRQAERKKEGKKYKNKKKTKTGHNLAEGQCTILNTESSKSSRSGDVQCNGHKYRPVIEQIDGDVGTM
jgi:hypothetical protein